VKSTTDRVWDLVGGYMAVALRSNPSQKLFRFAAFATSMLFRFAGGGNVDLG
jgi:hypothetical protein